MKLIEIKGDALSGLNILNGSYLEPTIVNGLLTNVRITSPTGPDIWIGWKEDELRVVTEVPKKKVKRWRVKGQLLGLVYYAQEFHTKELAVERLAEIEEMISEDWDSGLTVEEFELEVED